MTADSETTTRTAVGLDVGGTKAAGVLVTEDGEVVARHVAETPAEDVDATMDTLYDVIATLQKEGDPLAVGIGGAGMVDFDAGVMRYAPNLAWRELPIRDLVAEHTGLPCVLDNDANAACWGEYRFGAARGYRYVLLLTVGTGIGGGIVADGALYRGAHGFGAEVGHVVVDPEGPLCGCGNRGCFEQVASGRAIDRLGREAADAHPDGLIATLAGTDEVGGRHVTEAARQGDAVARRIIEDVGGRLGLGIAGFVNVLDPEVVVVGGGVADIGALLLDPAREAFRAAVLAPDHRPEVPIVPAALGNDAGAIGAATIALELALTGADGGAGEGRS
ncbi:MAG TPA: ROK family glucokinase [Actinomycetota bacterium]|nr:ROK family glucokinase [Actinomycetota bacterium]